MTFLNILVFIILFPFLSSNKSVEKKEQAINILVTMEMALANDGTWTQEAGFDEHDDGFPMNLNQLLRWASDEVSGEYQHRGIASKTLRNAIKRHPKYKKHYHPIFGFNNQEDVTLQDILYVIRDAIDIISAKK